MFYNLEHICIIEDHLLLLVGGVASSQSAYWRVNDYLG